MSKRDPKMTTIIRREEVIEGGHHGGAWKVAYADFVTAMMAFFLLMWLLNATTEAQRRGLADYFSPSAAVTVQRSGTGRPLGGQSPFDDGEAISDRGTLAVMNANAPPVDLEDDGSDTLATRAIHRRGGGRTSQGQRTARRTARPARQRARRPSGAPPSSPPQEQASFAQAAAEMQKAIAADPDLAPIAHQLSIDLTPEGLRVQIRDSEGLPMFANGSPEPNDARACGAATPDAHADGIARAGGRSPAIRMPRPYPGAGRSNWDLSADRANATRRILTEAGLPDGRIRDVTGHGDRDPLADGRSAGRGQPADRHPAAALGAAARAGHRSPEPAVSGRC